MSIWPMSASDKHIMWLLFLCVSLVLVCLPRFNRKDIGVKALTDKGQSSHETQGDASQYIMLTLFFRGQKGLKKQLTAPFTYRPFVPFVASLLPFEPMTSINLVNLLALLVALVFLYKILHWLELDLPLCIVGCALFIFSFPTFYYGTIGYVDPVLVSFLMIGTYCILTERQVTLALILITGALVKETIIILLPVLAVHLIVAKKPWKKQLVCLSLFVFLFVVTSYFARLFSPDRQTYLWLPSFEIFLFNASRPRSWTSFLLTFGVPGFISLGFISLNVFSYANRQTFWKIFVNLGPFIAGLIMTIVLFGYSMISAYADGRFIWTSYPFSIPIAMVMVRSRLKPSLRL